MYHLRHLKIISRYWFEIWRLTLMQFHEEFEWAYVNVALKEACSILHVFPLSFLLPRTFVCLCGEFDQKTCPGLKPCCWRARSHQDLLLSQTVRRWGWIAGEKRVVLYSFVKSITLNWICSRNIVVYFFVFLPCLYLVFTESLYPALSSTVTKRKVK